MWSIQASPDSSEALRTCSLRRNATGRVLFVKVKQEPSFFQVVSRRIDRLKSLVARTLAHPGSSGFGKHGFHS